MYLYCIYLKYLGRHARPNNNIVDTDQTEVLAIHKWVIWSGSALFALCV